MNTNPDTNNITISPAVAGYHILMILAEVDGQVATEENAVIRQYLEERHPLQLDPNYEVAFLDAMDRGHYNELFEQAANEYYMNSTIEQRVSFIQFAFDIIKADDKITKEENIFLNMLYDLWQLDPNE